MSVRNRGFGHFDVTSMRDHGDQALHDTEVGSIEQVVVKIDCQQFGADLAESCGGVVVPRRFEPVQNVVSIVLLACSTRRSYISVALLRSGACSCWRAGLTVSTAKIGMTRSHCVGSVV
jgi:hypothetical protein